MQRREPKAHRRASLALALNNAQGELSPLEVGLHALHSGLSGSEYARQVGMKQGTIAERITAARVADHVRGYPLTDRWQHLSAIHPAPHWLWRALVAALVADGWTVEATRKAVAGVKDAPWFVAKDVCEALGLGNVSMAADKLDRDEKGISSIDTLGGAQELQPGANNRAIAKVLGVGPATVSRDTQSDPDGSLAGCEPQETKLAEATTDPSGSLSAPEVPSAAASANLVMNRQAKAVRKAEVASVPQEIFEMPCTTQSGLYIGRRSSEQASRRRQSRKRSEPHRASIQKASERRASTFLSSQSKCARHGARKVAND